MFLTANEKKVTLGIVELEEKPAYTCAKLEATEGIIHPLSQLLSLVVPSSASLLLILICLRNLNNF